MEKYYRVSDNDCVDCDEACAYVDSDDHIQHCVDGIPYHEEVGAGPSDFSLEVDCRQIPVGLVTMMQHALDKVDIQEWLVVIQPWEGLDQMNAYRGTCWRLLPMEQSMGHVAWADDCFDMDRSCSYEGAEDDAADGASALLPPYHTLHHRLFGVLGYAKILHPQSEPPLLVYAASSLQMIWEVQMLHLLDFHQI